MTVSNSHHRFFLRNTEILHDLYPISGAGAVAICRNTTSTDTVITVSHSTDGVVYNDISGATGITIKAGATKNITIASAPRKFVKFVITPEVTENEGVVIDLQQDMVIPEAHRTDAMACAITGIET